MKKTNRPLVPQSVHASSDQCVTHSAGAGAEDAASVAGGDFGLVGSLVVRWSEGGFAAWFAAAFAAAIAPAASCAGGRLSKRLKLEPPIFLLASLSFLSLPDWVLCAVWIALMTSDLCGRRSHQPIWESKDPRE